MLGRGTTLVRVTAIDPYTFGRKRLYFNHDKPFYLQVGAFRNKMNAQKYQQHLTALLNTPVNVAQPSNSHLYHVQIGPMQDATKAKKIANRLRELGIKSNKRYGA
jgi:cell division protein FtsN